MKLPTYVSGTVQTRAYTILRGTVYGVLSKYDLTPSLWSMLGIIMEAQDGIRQSEVARLMDVKAPLITVMVRQMKNRGLIQTVKNQFDARAKLLSVTVSGKKSIKTIEAELYQELQGLLTGLTENDLITYHKVLTTIILHGNHRK